MYGTHTHLTINGSTDVTDISKYYAHETSHASESVNLLDDNGQINPDSGNAPIVTDPYSVPVGKTASNNPPFIVKRSKELPAGQKNFRSHNSDITRKVENEKKNVKTHK